MAIVKVGYSSFFISDVIEQCLFIFIVGEIDNWFMLIIKDKLLKHKAKFNINHYHNKSFHDLLIVN